MAQKYYRAASQFRVGKKPVLGDIVMFNKPDREGFTWKKFDHVTVVNFNKKTKKEVNKWVKYF